MIRFDHVAVACTELAQGVEWVQDCLGVPLQQGGKHAHFGTHNYLLGLTGGEYFEVIAIDPDAPPLGFPRWFDLDRFTGGPRLGNWICSSEDLTALCGAVPHDIGAPVSLQRGDLRWKMAMPDSGILPFDNLFPAVIEWGTGTTHPAGGLVDRGVTLRELRLIHPDSTALSAALAPWIDDTRLVVDTGSAPKIEAVFETPHGVRTLA